MYLLCLLSPPFFPFVAAGGLVPAEGLASLLLTSQSWLHLGPPQPVILSPVASSLVLLNGEPVVLDSQPQWIPTLLWLSETFVK